MTQEETIIQRVELLEGLIESQKKTLEIDNRIIEMKNSLLEMTEQENSIQRKEIALLRIMCSVAVFIIACLLISEILSLR
jgi:hypothetical protein